LTRRGAKALKHKAARFDALRSGTTDASTGKLEIIPEDSTGWEKTLVEMWNKGYSRGEIANRVGVSKDRVTNRATELRNKFGKTLSPMIRVGKND
jgi:DNA-binding NarL/FixJ family response regulator